MSATTIGLSVPEWRRNCNQQAGFKDEDPCTRPSKRTYSISPTRSRQASRENESTEKARSTSANWSEREQRRQGRARTAAQRLNDRLVREERLRALSADEVPTEGERKQLYKKLKLGTNTFTTWLVEAVYHGGENRPAEIEHVYNAKKDHAKYKMPVNHFIILAEALAERQEQTISEKMSLLDDIISERSQYSYWMGQLSANDEDCELEKENHQHFIDIMEDAKTILCHGNGTKPSPDLTQTRSGVKPAAQSIQRHNSTLGKRKSSPTSQDRSEQRKAAKTATTLTSTTPTSFTSMKNPRPILGLRSRNKQDEAAKQQTDKTWRRVAVDTCDKTNEKRCAPMAKMSWAAVAAIAT
ncbi:hypothetical protein MMC28_007372 [Mycoblastus sanguinarius]|nr:hypothetical protein [Mycoblastus sanguinarius]